MTEVDYGYLAQKAAEERLALCEAWMDYEEGEGEPEPEEPNPACAPYCGCTTCMVREVLDAAWPIIEQSVRVNGRSRPENLLAVDLSKVKPEHFTPHRQMGPH